MCIALFGSRYNNSTSLVYFVWQTINFINLWCDSAWNVAVVPCVFVCSGTKQQFQFLRYFFFIYYYCWWWWRWIFFASCNHLAFVIRLQLHKFSMRICKRSKTIWQAKGKRILVEQKIKIVLDARHHHMEWY